MKKVFKIPNENRIAILIVAGYYEDLVKIAYSVRKEYKKKGKN